PTTDRLCGSGRRPKMRCDFAQPRRDGFARATWSFCNSVGFFLADRHSREHFLTRDHPIHRNRMTTLTWTDQTQRPGSARAANDDDPVTIDQASTGEAITLVIERVPFPVAIEPL